MPVASTPLSSPPEVGGAKMLLFMMLMFTWTFTLKVRRSAIPTVLCMIWICMHSWVTASVPVLKTTCFPYSNRRCCHIRVFHPYLTVWSPPLIISWHGTRGGYGHALATPHGHVMWEWQDFDEPFVTLQDSRLLTFQKNLIYYSSVFRLGLSCH